MASDNQVTVVGNLTDEPELRFTPSGQALCRFSIANNRRWQDRSTGEWKEEASFFNVVTWRDLAENVSASLHKGDRVVISGRLQQRSWENQQGERRSTVEITADEIGPSLRWATADVTRKARREGEGGFGGGAPADMPEPVGDDWGGGNGDVAF
ncbi:MAG: single-stranded DNA-binding protein [Actinobacteria bacterium ATB1]|nr:single-stranded DNA-binding protein [Actinobacteria bacterium ATB1]